MNRGVVYILIFVVATAFRDVFFGGVFQKFRFFDVMLIAFSLTTAIFSTVVAIGMRDQIRALARAWRETLVVNLGTAAAWLSYFYALKLLEPAIVNTIHTGAGPLTLVGLSALGLHISRPTTVRRIERFVHLGTFSTLMALSAVVLLDLSGLPGRGIWQNTLGLGLAFASGGFIAASSDVTKRMHERGVRAEAVLAVRFIAIVMIGAFMASHGHGDGEPVSSARSFAIVAGAALVLIAAPVYVLQLGLARISALSTWVLISLGPALVFVAQLLDSRIAYSVFTLGCIALYSACVVSSTLLRRFEADRKPRAARPA